METDVKKVKLNRLNSHITCYICKGYLIDAITITECLHTFCKSCLVKHFETKQTCPKCEILVHQSNPLHYVIQDNVIQELVYKLVPGLQETEKFRRKEFCQTHGIQMEDEEEPAAAPSEQTKVAEEDPDCHRSDVQVNLNLKCNSKGIRHLHRPYVRVSTAATISHVKKLIALSVFDDIQKYKELDILCNNEIMGKDQPLWFILRTRWRCKQQPMELEYRNHVEL